MMELMIAAGKAVAQLQIEHGLAVERVYTGSFMTSLDMAGNYGTPTLSCSMLGFCGSFVCTRWSVLPYFLKFGLYSSGCKFCVFFSVRIPLHVPRTHFYEPDLCLKLRLSYSSEDF